jgi:hypothetical protein
MILAVIASIILLTFFIPFDAPASYGDFQAYWSASYLLARSQNFTDLDLLLQVEQSKTGWTQDFVMATWNPPWLLVLLIPFTLVPFRQAAWLWTLTNIGLIFSATLLSWRIFTHGEKGSKWDWVALLLAFLFVPTLLALFVGQVNTLVYFGLAGFLFFYTTDKPLTAGVILSLTLVKPHLVYLTLPIIFLMATRQSQWRVWVGFIGMVLLLTLVALGLRPTMVAEYGRTMTNANLLNWQTPTLGGILTALFGWEWSKWMGAVILPLTIIVWYLQKDRTTLLTWVNGTVLISVITAPFGWGYDAIVLLLPILQMVSRALNGLLVHWHARLIIGILVIADGILLYQRLKGINELYYFWLPVVLAAFYGWAMLNRKHQVIGAAN